MHKGRLRANSREADIYDSFEEVCEIAYDPPRYCERDSTELIYYSFFDQLNRFTLKAGCKTCGRSWAVGIKKENYENRMLQHWTRLVKERADFKCEMESSQCSGVLHAHHIIPKHLEPSKKYDVENGMCLCERHHKLIHRYMDNNN